MQRPRNVSPVRRRILRAGVALSAAALALPGRDAAAEIVALPLTPACDDGDEPTPSQTAGPFFTPDSPERASLHEPDIEGVPIVLAGLVLTRDCRPIAGALLDFWHADDAGAYDNDGYRLRGHQFADDAGRYRLETIVPGLYPGRTRHFHVRVQPPGGSVLTTQLYFPGEPQNDRDRLFTPALLITEDAAGARFDFVLEQR